MLGIGLLTVEQTFTPSLPNHTLRKMRTPHTPDGACGPVTCVASRMGQRASFDHKSIPFPRAPLVLLPMLLGDPWVSSGLRKTMNGVDLVLCQN